MKSIFIIKSAATIALCAMLFSCSKKINLATSQQSTKQTPSAKHSTISGWNAPSVSLTKEDRPVSKSLSVIKTETLHQEIETPVSTNSKTTTKKFIYESGYKPKILKPRPFVPEARYTSYQETNKTEVTTSNETVLIPTFASAGALVLALIVKRLL